MVDHAKRLEYGKHLFFEANSIDAPKDRPDNIPQASGLDVYKARRFFSLFFYSLSISDDLLGGPIRAHRSFFVQ